MQRKRSEALLLALLSCSERRRAVFERQLQVVLALVDDFLKFDFGFGKLGNQTRATGTLRVVELAEFLESLELLNLRLVLLQNAY